MDRCYTDGELSKLVENCIKTQVNMLPYCCRENIDAWWVITLCINAVKKYNITPERYWHGNCDEFTQLLVLIDGGYPSPGELLKMAEKKTSDEIRNIANHFYQYTAVMFEHVKDHHGYVVLRPTPFMQSLYPCSKDMLYVYTKDKWTHREQSHIDGVVLTLPADKIESLPNLLRKKIESI